MIAAAIALTAIPFAPPLDHALRYRTTETRPSPAGAPIHDTLDQEVRFARDGDGYVLTVTGIAYSTDDPRTRRLVDAAVAPTIGVPLRLRVERDGRASGVIDGAANWAAVIAGMRAAAALPGSDAARRQATAAFAALTPAERDAQLLQCADDILPPPGARVEHRHADHVRPQPGGRELLIAEDVDVSPQSGLIVSRRRVLRGRADAKAGVLSLGETTTRIIGY